MLIIRKNQTNNLIATVSMNKTLANPYYLFSFQHIASKERISFIPQVITSNVRYDKFRFVEAPNTNLSTTPPQVFFEYLGQYYYSIYEQVSSGNTDPSLAYNKLESGRAWVIVGNDDMDECFFEPYISNDEDFAQIIYVSEEEENCIYPNITPSITPSNTPTPSITPTNTSTPTNTPTNTQTPTNTPSITPTNTGTPTPTPSTTPPANINPQTLGALWWIDFTDAATIGSAFGQIFLAEDKIANVQFTAPAGSGGPLYNPFGYLGISGTAQTNATQLKNALGTYTTAFTEYTWFGRVYDDVVSQRGGKIIVASNGGSYPTGNTFFTLADFNLNPYPPGPVWYIETETSAGNNIINTNFTFSAWTDIAIRVYQSGSKVRTEFWENGIEITHIENTASPFTTSDVEFNLMWDGGIDFNTEQFFFARKLTGGEMTQMFNYLTNKY